MSSAPKKVTERIAAGIKRFQPVVAAAKSRDAGESDTVTIVVDMLQDLFGYDKYTEGTSEYSIRGTYCDLATKLDGKIATLIEVKAVGMELKDSHVKQAIDYAANKGVDWVILTNAVSWKIYNVLFVKPIGQELILDIDFSAVNPRSADDIELLYMWCKEGWTRSVIGEYKVQKEALSRFYLSAAILSDPVLFAIRLALRRLSPDAKIDIEQISAVLREEVIKREVIESDKLQEAQKRISRAAGKSLRTTAKSAGAAEVLVPPVSIPSPPAV